MDDSNQIEVPASFTALFASPSGHRLTAPMHEVRTRYELCEDLAQLLTEDAQVTRFKTGGSEAEVLEAILIGLRAPESAVTGSEAGWIVRRLAELLDWPALPG